MKIKILIACTIIFYGTLITQDSCNCTYKNESNFCSDMRLTGGLINLPCTLFTCSMKPVIAIFSNVNNVNDVPSISTALQEMWCPYNYPCDTPLNTCNAVAQWGTTVGYTACIILSCVSASPCIKERHYKRIRKKCCSCLSDENCFLPSPPEYLANPDGTLR